MSIYSSCHFMSLRTVGIANHLLANFQLQLVLALAFEIRTASVDRKIRNTIRQMNAANPLRVRPGSTASLVKRDV